MQTINLYPKKQKNLNKNRRVFKHVHERVLTCQQIYKIINFWHYFNFQIIKLIKQMINLKEKKKKNSPLSSSILELGFTPLSSWNIVVAVFYGIHEVASLLVMIDQFIECFYYHRHTLLHDLWSKPRLCSLTFVTNKIMI